MSGNSKQDKVKRDRRSAAMSATDDGDDHRWVAPSPDECEEIPGWWLTPDGADIASERIKVRMVLLAATDELAEFAVIHQTWHQGSWVDVAVADSSHDDEVHIHFYGRRSEARVGSPQHVLDVRKLADVDAGYVAVYPMLIEDWRENLRRWNDN